MAITPTGSVTNNIPVNGDYLVGDGGNGGLTVDAGSVFSVTTPNAANEPLLAFGFTAGASVPGAPPSGEGSGVGSSFATFCICSRSLDGFASIPLCTGAADAASCSAEYPALSSPNAYRLTLSAPN